MALGCSEADSSFGQRPWDSYETSFLPHETTILVNPAYPNEGLIASYKVEGIEPAQILRIYLDTGETECLTCDHSKSFFNQNYYFRYSPDGEHIIFTSSRDRPPGQTNLALIGFGGEIYIMDRHGDHPQRLTYLNGFARAGEISSDGKVLTWDQITSDNRWHLLFSELVWEGDTFRLGEIKEARLLADSDAPPSTVYTRQLAMAEWKHPAPVPDCFSLFGTFASTMNFDSYALCLNSQKAYRLTSHPEFEEFSLWDPTGHGVVTHSAREHNHVRQLFPIPVPAFADYFLVILGFMAVQTARTVPWGSDLFYLGAGGEAQMIKLVEGASDGFFTWPLQWSEDARQLYFGMIRVGLENPDPASGTLKYGRIDFEGRPGRTDAARNVLRFLESAAIEKYLIEIAPFDPSQVVPKLDVTIPGGISGQVTLSIDAHADFSVLRGSFLSVYENFSDGDYSYNGQMSADLDFGTNLLNASATMDLDLSVVDANGLPYRLIHHWKSKGLDFDAEITFERRGNTETRKLHLDPTQLLGSQ